MCAPRRCSDADAYEEHIRIARRFIGKRPVLLWESFIPFYIETLRAICKKANSGSFPRVILSMSSIVDVIDDVRFLPDVGS